MKLIRVAAAVLNQTPLDWHGNRARIEEAIARAREESASILCLPEMCITGYGCEDAFHAIDVQQTAAEILLELLPQTRGMVVSLGLPLAFRQALFNAACLVADGRILGFVGKRFLASDGIHYESRWFKPWPVGEQVAVSIGEESYPLGDLYFDVGGIKIGFEICEDAWVADRPGAALARRGVDIILNPSASHFAFGKFDVRQRFVLEGSRAFGVSYLYANLLGNEAGRAIYDGGALIASRGTLLAAGSRFSFADVEVTSAIIDIDATRTNQIRTGSYRPHIGHDPVACLEAPFAYPVVRSEMNSVRLATWESGGFRKEEEFARAVALGLFDYLRKSRSSGFVVSLSGGADSAACACLVSIMTRLGIGSVGLERFLAKLGIAALQGKREEREIVAGLLTCVYQATRNSSETTRSAAEEVAAAIGARFWQFDIDALVSGYLGIVEHSLGRQLSWQTDDIALQNIQARVRSPGVWMVANLQNALLVSTSNRSEAAVGYATMDGDTSGGISPIAGIDKAFLRRWLQWLEVHGPEGLGPIPAVAAVTRQAPTAELRPQAAAQTDEDDLMPYPLLDAIERAVIRDKQSPVEVLEAMRLLFPMYSLESLGLWIDRFFKLWCRNQWKRERYAPSFHLDDENLDPKTWCRFPILSGGFARELAELKAYVAALVASGQGHPDGKGPL